MSILAILGAIISPSILLDKSNTRKLLFLPAISNKQITALFPKRLLFKLSTSSLQFRDEKASERTSQPNFPILFEDKSIYLAFCDIYFSRDYALVSLRRLLES